MAGPAHKLPTFVPRTIQAYERTAGRLARRLSPVRDVAARVLSFADRVVGGWLQPVLDLHGGRPAPASAGLSPSLLPMPRPWYGDEEPAEDTWAPGPRRQAAPAGGPRVAPAAPALASAERGAAIPRTTLAHEAPAAPVGTGAAEGRVARAEVATRSAEVAHADAGAADGGRRDGDLGQGIEAPEGGAPVEGAGAPVAPWAGREDVRVIELLGTQAVARPVGPAVRPVARPPAPTALARPLAHAAWVDASVRRMASPPTVEVGGQPAGAPSYVFVAAAVETAEGQTAEGRPLARPVRAGVRSAQVAMPDLRLSPRLVPPAPPAATRTASFVEQLVGAQVARDTSPLAVVPRVGPAEMPALAIAGQAPQPVTLRPEAPAVAAAAPPPSVPAPATTGTLDFAPPTLPPVPVWGTPPEARAFAPAPPTMEAPFFAPAPALSGTPPSAPAPEPTTTVDALRPGGAARLAEQLGEILDGRAQLAWGEPAAAVPLQAAAAPVGPAAIARFLDGLAGVDAARTAAPRPLEAPADEPTAAAAARAPARELVRGAGGAPRPREGQIATPAPMTPAAATAPSQPWTAGAWQAPLRPGGIAVRAEQLGGVVGVRASTLSLDFVDPARLPAVAAPTVQERAPAMSAAEFALVATFPSAQTAVQVAEARRAATWRTGGSVVQLVQPIAPAGTTQTATQARRPLEAWTAAAAARAAEQVSERATAQEAAAVRAAGQVGERATGPEAAGAGALRGFDGERVIVAPGVAARPTETFDDALVRVVAGAPRERTPGPGSRPATGAPVTLAVAARGGAPAELVAPVVVAADRVTLPTGRAPRGAVLWPKAAAFQPATPPFQPSHGATQVATALEQAPGAPLWEAIRAVAGERTMLAGPVGEAPGHATPVEAARLLAPVVAAVAPGRGAVSAGGEVGAEAAFTAGTEGTRSGGSDGASGAARPRVREAVRGELAGIARLAEARPFLELIRGGLSPVDTGPRTREAASQFSSPPQPLVQAAPAGDAAAKMVAAVQRQAPAATDDRITLADLTLISIASATQQVAATPVGARPPAARPQEAPAAPPAAAPAVAKPHQPSAAEINDLAIKVYDELKRLLEIARERSGDPWES